MTQSVALGMWGPAGLAARWRSRADVVLGATAWVEEVVVQGAAAGADADAVLLSRIAEGERAALVELHERFAAPLWRFLVRLVGDPLLAEEVLQDTWLSVWRGAGSFEGRSSAKTWVYAVARRQARDRLRGRRVALVELDEAAHVVDAEPSPEDAALRAADREVLAGLLGRLSAVHREVLVLCFVAELSYSEIAEVLAVPLGTVKSRLSNARRALAELAAAEMGDQP